VQQSRAEYGNSAAFEIHKNAYIGRSLFAPSRLTVLKTVFKTVSLLGAAIGYITFVKNKSNKQESPCIAIKFCPSLFS